MAGVGGNFLLVERGQTKSSFDLRRKTKKMSRTGIPGFPEEQLEIGNIRVCPQQLVNVLPCEYLTCTSLRYV